MGALANRSWRHYAPTLRSNNFLDLQESDGGLANTAEKSIVYLNVVPDKPNRFAAAVTLAGPIRWESVGVVGWQGGAPICDSCNGSRVCAHAAAMKEHITKMPGMCPRAHKSIAPEDMNLTKSRHGPCTRHMDAAELSDSGLFQNDVEDDNVPDTSSPAPARPISTRSAVPDDALAMAIHARSSGAALPKIDGVVVLSAKRPECCRDWSVLSFTL